MTRNNYSPLRWLTSQEKQDHRKSYSNGKKYPLLVPDSRFPKFQVIRDINEVQPVDFDEFVLIDRDGNETDILSTMITNSGLYVVDDINQNYDYTGSSAQILPSDIRSKSWGFTMGAPESFSRIKVKIFTLDIGGDFTPSVPLVGAFKCVVKESRDGAILKQATIINITTADYSEKELVFQWATATYNPDGLSLWIEIRSNLEFCMMGRDGALLTYPTERGRYGLSGDLNDPPNVDEPGAIGDYDGWVQWSGGGMDYEVIINPQLTIITGSPPLGIHEARMSDGVNTWYSELFCFVNDVSTLMKLTWWHRYNLPFPGGHIHYEDGFKNEIYINSVLARPEWPAEIDDDQRNGYPLFKSGSVHKVYKFNFLGVEYLIDAMSLIILHHDVTIDFDGDTFTAIPHTFLITPEPLRPPAANVFDIQIEFRNTSVVFIAGDNTLPVGGEDLVAWEFPDGGNWLYPDGSSTWLYF